MAGLTIEQLAQLECASGGAFDELFLQYMIIHHEGAVRMVEDLLTGVAGGQESQVFQIARHVESDQQVEISRMRSVLAELAIFQQRNQDCGGLWVRQVRFIKLFVRERLDGCIKGIHVEKFAWDAVKDEMPHDEAVAAILATGAGLLAPGVEYTEPTGVERIDDRLGAADRARAHREFAAAAAQAARAVEHTRNGDHNAAIAIWHNIFGDDFPKPDATAAISDLGRGAGIADVITGSAPVAAKPTRAWRTEA